MDDPDSAEYLTRAIAEAEEALRRLRPYSTSLDERMEVSRLRHIIRQSTERLTLLRLTKRRK